MVILYGCTNFSTFWFLMYSMLHVGIIGVIELEKEIFLR